jgi:hypothetical protein
MAPGEAILLKTFDSRRAAAEVQQKPKGRESHARVSARVSE